MRSQRKYSSSMMPIPVGLIVFLFSFGTSASGVVANPDCGLHTILLILLSTTIELPINYSYHTTHKDNYFEALHIKDSRGWDRNLELDN